MIQGLTTKVLADFSGGRVTNQNLAEMTEERCLVAHNVVFLGDKAVAKRPGYTLVTNVGAAPMLGLYDWQRDIDSRQWLVVNGNGLLALADPKGIGAALNLSSGEDALAGFAYAQNLFNLYLSNGLKSYRVVDKAGANTLYKWGIAPPAAAPAVAASPGGGTLTLLHGRQYCFCYVSYWTDTQGTKRMHIGPPSPLSAYSGTVFAGHINLSGMTAATDAQISHKWIFATVDAAKGTAAEFYFAAEIANATTTFADDLDDSELDTSRQAPWDNYPAPLASILVPYASRIAAVGIQGNPHLVQFSGLEEVDLGIPEEAWPPYLAFEVPGQKFTLTAAAAFQNALMLSTADYWFAVTGYDSATFQKQDRILEPGAAGRRCVAVTPKYLIWLGTDKTLWAWDGTSLPIDVSKLLQKSLPGALSMEDLDSAQLAGCELRYLKFGRYHWVVLAGTNAAPHDWLQIWDFSSLLGQLSDGSSAGLVEADMFPADLMATTAIVEVDCTPYLYFGDPGGNIYRFPDGYTDAGKSISTPMYGMAWSSLSGVLGSVFRLFDPADVTKRLYSIDLLTDRADAAEAFGVQAIAAPAPDMDLALIDCEVGPLYSPEGVNPKALRADLQREGTAVGRWFRCVVRFPDDGAPATLYRISIANAAISGVNP